MQIFNTFGQRRRELAIWEYCYICLQRMKLFRHCDSPDQLQITCSLPFFLNVFFFKSNPFNGLLKGFLNSRQRLKWMNSTSDFVYLTDSCNRTARQWRDFSLFVERPGNFQELSFIRSHRCKHLRECSITTVKTSPFNGSNKRPAKVIGENPSAHCGPFD